MGASSDQLDREIAETRSSIEDRIVRLRQQGRRQAQRYARTALIAIGVGAAVGVAAVGIYAVYRYTRPPSRRERLQRFIPVPVALRLRDLARLRETLELGLRRQIPSMRLYIGERQVGEDPPKSRLHRIAVEAAQAAGTAAGTSVATSLARRLLAGLRPAA